MLKAQFKKGKPFAAIFLSILFFSGTANAVCTGLTIPLYTWPGATWDEVIAAKRANPNVPFYVIANIDSSPGTAPQPLFQTYIQKLQAGGVMVLGYVTSKYAAKPLDQFEKEVSEWREWYHVNGIMIDEMNNTANPAYYAYYRDITAYAKSLGMTYTMGNPGAPTAPGYIGTVDAIQIREGAGLPTAAAVAGITFNRVYPSSNFSILGYSIPTLDAAAVKALMPYVGLIWVTSGNEPNPYNVIPPYLNELAATLNTDSCAP